MRLSAGLGDRLFRRNRGRKSDGSDPPPSRQDEEAAAAASPGNGITLREINNASSAVVPGEDNSNVDTFEFKVAFSIG